MADLLIKSGVLAPETWTNTLGAVLSAQESVMISGQRVTRADLASRRDEWERAYLETPHGHPVQLLRP